MAKPKNDQPNKATVGDTGQTAQEIRDTLKNSGWTDEDIAAVPQLRNMLDR